MSLNVDSSEGPLQQIQAAVQALYSIHPEDQELRNKVVPALANIGIAPKTDLSKNPYVL